MLSASAAAAASAADFAFRLGQRVVHTRLGYEGVVCGLDRRCYETDEWARAPAHTHLAFATHVTRRGGGRRRARAWTRCRAGATSRSTW